MFIDSFPVRISLAFLLIIFSTVKEFSGFLLDEDSTYEISTVGPLVYTYVEACNRDSYV